MYDNEKENEFYSDKKNWNFSDLNYTIEEIKNFDFYKTISENTNLTSLCLLELSNIFLKSSSNFFPILLSSSKFLVSILNKIFLLLFLLMPLFLFFQSLLHFHFF